MREMPSITKRYMKDRSRPNPKRNPIKHGVSHATAMDELDDSVYHLKMKIASVRREGPLVDELRRLCGGCLYFKEVECECNVHGNKCPKGLLHH